MSGSLQSQSVKRLVWLLTFAVMSTTAVHMIKPIVAYKILHLGFSVGAVGIVAGGFGLIPLLVAIPLGEHLDRHGGRWASSGGAAILVLGATVLALAQSVLGLLIGNALLGLGHLGVVLGMEREVAALGSTRRTTWFGYLTASHSLSQMIGPLIAGAVLTGVGSGATVDQLINLSRSSLMAAGAVVGVGVVIERVFGGRHEFEPAGGPSSSSLRALGGLLRSDGVVRFVWMSMVVTVSIDLLAVYLPVLGEFRGVSPGTVGLMLALRAGAALVARAVVGPVTTVLGEERLLFLSVIVPAAMCVTLALVWHDAIIATAVIIGGFFLGFGQPMVITQLVGMVPKGSVGRVLSLRLAANRLGFVAVPAGAGAVAGVMGPYMVFLILAGMFGVSVVHMLSAMGKSKGSPESAGGQAEA